MHAPGSNVRFRDTFFDRNTNGPLDFGDDKQPRVLADD